MSEYIGSRQMQGVRKILRALAIFLFAGVSLWLLVGAAVNGPGEYQLAAAAVLMLAALGLVATWFWSPFG
jgi:hypothetical protein